MQTQHCSQFLHIRQTVPAMLNSNYIGYKVSFIPTKCFIRKKLTFRLLFCRLHQSIHSMHKTPLCMLWWRLQNSSRNVSFVLIKHTVGYFVTMNSQPRASLREQLHCIHPQHTLSIHSNMHYTPSNTLPTAFHNPAMHTTNKHKA